MGSEQIVEFASDPILDRFSIKTLLLSKELFLPQHKKLLMDLFVDIVVAWQILIDVVDEGLVGFRCLISMTAIEPEHQIVHYSTHNWHVSNKFFIIESQ